MRLPSVNPGQIRELAADGVGAAQRVRSMVPRIATLLDAGEILLDRITTVVTRIDQTDAHARAVIGRVDATQALARSVVEEAAAALTRVTALLDRYEPDLRAVAPAVDRLADKVTDTDVDALVTVVSRGPRLAQQFTDEVVPVLETLKTVAPDLTELLSTSRALNEMIGAVPGLGRVKKRVDDEAEHTE